jgi:nucleobase:cation symporter-1, NCS1 family
LLPGWCYPVFLLVIVAGAITNSVLTAYSTGLALQAVGIPWQRSVTVIFDAGVAISITCYALASPTSLTRSTYSALEGRACG